MLVINPRSRYQVFLEVLFVKDTWKIYKNKNHEHNEAKAGWSVLNCHSVGSKCVKIPEIFVFQVFSSVENHDSTVCPDLPLSVQAMAGLISLLFWLHAFTEISVCKYLVLLIVLFWTQTSVVILGSYYIIFCLFGSFTHFAFVSLLASLEWAGCWFNGLR